MFPPLGVSKAYTGIETVEPYLIALPLGAQSLVVIAQAQPKESETPFHFV